MKTYNFGNFNPPTPLANSEGKTAPDGRREDPAALPPLLERGLSPLVN